MSVVIRFAVLGVLALGVMVPMAEARGRRNRVYYSPAPAAAPAVANATPQVAQQGAYRSFSYQPGATVQSAPMTYNRSTYQSRNAHGPAGVGNVFHDAGWKTH